MSTICWDRRVTDSPVLIVTLCVRYTNCKLFNLTFLRGGSSESSSKDNKVTVVTTPVGWISTVSTESLSWKETRVETQFQYGNLLVGSTLKVMSPEELFGSSTDVIWYVKFRTTFCSNLWYGILFMSEDLFRELGKDSGNTPYHVRLYHRRISFERPWSITDNIHVYVLVVIESYSFSWSSRLFYFLSQYIQFDKLGYICLELPLGLSRVGVNGHLV